MSSEYNCQYGRTCPNYDHDSICCTFLFKLCKYAKGQEAIAKRISEESRLFELSQINRDGEITENPY
jgi:hypothetical protein